MLGSKKNNGSPNRNTPFKWLRRLFRRIKYRHCKFKDGKYTSGRKDVELWREDHPITSLDYPDFRWQAFTGVNVPNYWNGQLQQQENGVSPTKDKSTKVKTPTPKKNSKNRKPSKERKRKHASLAQNPFRTNVQTVDQETQTSCKNIKVFSEQDGICEVTPIEDDLNTECSDITSIDNAMDNTKYGISMKRSGALNNLHRYTVDASYDGDTDDNELGDTKMEVDGVVPNMKPSDACHDIHQYTVDVHQCHSEKSDIVRKFNPRCQMDSRYKVYTTSGPHEETLFVEYDIDETGVKKPIEFVTSQGNHDRIDCSEYEINDHTGLKVPWTSSSAVSNSMPSSTNIISPSSRSSKPMKIRIPKQISTLHEQEDVSLYHINSPTRFHKDPLQPAPITPSKRAKSVSYDFIDTEHESVQNDFQNVKNQLYSEELSRRRRQSRKRRKKRRFKKKVYQTLMRPRGYKSLKEDDADKEEIQELEDEFEKKKEKLQQNSNDFGTYSSKEKVTDKVSRATRESVRQVLDGLAGLTIDPNQHHIFKSFSSNPYVDTPPVHRQSEVVY